MRMPSAGGNFRHIMVEGFVLKSGEIERIGPLHAFDQESLSRILSRILEDSEGAVLKLTIEAIEPDECIDYRMKRRVSIEVLGHVPEELEQELRRNLRDER